jgi:hypothetical protein
MAILKSAQRKKLPTSEFAGPGRTFPIPDGGHGEKALQLDYNKPPAEQASIKAKVKRKFPGIK